jgi:O-acetyl-ADP-ribose deacetylase (regulator of RNase III)
MKNTVTYKKGNLFTSDCQTLVNTVNCVGVMGAGIALEFKYRYPEMFDKYVRYCDEKLIQIGKLWVYDIPNTTRKILNFPTKQHWKYPSKYEYLEQGLKKFVETYKEKGIISVAFPLLGTLNGGLDSNRVSDLMYKHLGNCDISVEIYEFDEFAPDELMGPFRQFLSSASVEQLEKLTGIKKTALKKLHIVLHDEKLNRLIQLDKIKGLGEETVKACFRFAMSLRKGVQTMQYDMFDSVNDNQSNSFGRGHMIVGEFNNKTLPFLDARLVLAGLDRQTVLAIENNAEEVSIKAIRTYCRALSLDFEGFIIRNYFHQRKSASK